ncbi:hypothetical protein D3C87_1717440 [compost metagenome]
MDRFAICQAYAQLESDYNKSGWLQERPSNQRRKESIGCQLSRIGYSSRAWVEIEAERDDDLDDPMDDEVREIYMRHVLLWKLPIDDDLRAAMQRFFTCEYLAGFPPFA